MLSKLPTWLRAAVITGLQTVAGAILLIVLNLALDIQGWVSDRENPVDFSTPAALGGAAVMAFVVGLVTAVYRAVRPVENAYPEPPKPPAP